MMKNRTIILIMIVILIIGFLESKIIDKKFNDKFKIIWIKVFLSIDAITLLCGLILPNIFSVLINNVYFIFVLFLISFVAFSQWYFLMVYGNIKPPKPDKYILKQNSYEEFSSYLSDRVKEYDYELNIEKENLKIYKKSIKSRNYYIIDARLEELTEDNFNELYNEKIFPLIEEDFNKVQKKYYELYVSFIVSVNRITPMFNKFIEETNEEVRYYKLPIGISFGGNKMYLPSMIEGFQVFQINKLIKEFKEIMEVSD